MRNAYEFNFMSTCDERDDIPFKGSCISAPVTVEVQNADGGLPIVVVVRFNDEPVVLEYRSSYEKTHSWEQLLVEAVAIAELACARADIAWSTNSFPQECYGAFVIMMTKGLGFVLKD